MGVNAQIEVPAFTAGQVLTAAEMTQVNTGIPVFATTVTRDAAFGGAGEKVLAEGQFAYIEATNTTQYYDGAAWQSVGVTPGLVLITGASFSAVSSVSLPNSSFTSTYKNYKLFFSVTASSATPVVIFRFRASGTDDANNMYRQTTLGVQSSGTATNTVGDRTSFEVGATTSSAGGFIDLDLEINDMASATTIKSVGGFLQYNNGSGHFGQYTSGQINAAKAFDSVSFIASTGTITGFYRLYGYSES
jgi:hypothetical protein